MDKRMDHQRMIFTHVFRLSNILQVYLDNELKEDKITSKQMLFMIVVGSFIDQAPSFKEAAIRSGSSYQNVKQLALKLEKNGYVHISNDPIDKRAKRIHLTDKAMKYWNNREDKDTESIDKLFETFSLDELANFEDYIIRLQESIDRLDKEKRL